MTDWGTAAVSLCAALIGAASALGGALLSAKKDRALQLQDRRIKAAGDFSISAHQTSADLKDAVKSTPRADDPDKQKVLDALHQHLHEAEAHAMLASLVFKTTPGAVNPSDVIRVLQEAVLEVRVLYGDEVPEVKGDPSLDDVREKAKQADTDLERSIEAVLKTLEK